jgi:hypothetical protein
MLRFASRLVFKRNAVDGQIPNDLGPNGMQVAPVSGCRIRGDIPSILVRVEAGMSSAPPVLFVPLAGHGHKKRTGVGGVSAQPFRHTQAIHLGHQQVAKDHVRPEVAGFRKCGAAVENRMGLVPP